MKLIAALLLFPFYLAREIYYSRKLRRLNRRWYPKPGGRDV